MTTSFKFSYIIPVRFSYTIEIEADSFEEAHAKLPELNEESIETLNGIPNIELDYENCIVDWE